MTQNAIDQIITLHGGINNLVAIRLSGIGLVYISTLFGPGEDDDRMKFKFEDDKLIVYRYNPTPQGQSIPFVSTFELATIYELIFFYVPSIHDTLIIPEITNETAVTPPPPPPVDPLEQQKLFAETVRTTLNNSYTDSNALSQIIRYPNDLLIDRGHANISEYVQNYALPDIGNSSVTVLTVGVDYIVLKCGDDLAYCNLLYDNGYVIDYMTIQPKTESIPDIIEIPIPEVDPLEYQKLFAETVKTTLNTSYNDSVALSTIIVCPESELISKGHANLSDYVKNYAIPSLASNPVDIITVALNYLILSSGTSLIRADLAPMGGTPEAPIFTIMGMTIQPKIETFPNLLDAKTEPVEPTPPPETVAEEISLSKTIAGSANVGAFTNDILDPSVHVIYPSILSYVENVNQDSYNELTREYFSTYIFPNRTTYRITVDRVSTNKIYLNSAAGEVELTLDRFNGSLKIIDIQINKLISHYPEIFTGDVPPATPPEDTVTMQRTFAEYFTSLIDGSSPFDINAVRACFNQNIQNYNQIWANYVNDQMFIGSNGSNGVIPITGLNVYENYFTFVYGGDIRYSIEIEPNNNMTSFVINRVQKFRPIEYFPNITWN